MSWCCQACACWGAHPPPTPTNAAGTTCHSCWLQNVAQELNRPKRLIPFSAIQATSFGDAAASWLKCCACESVHCNPYEPETSGPGLAENFPQKALSLRKLCIPSTTQAQRVSSFTFQLHCPQSSHIVIILY